jgi:hypothetical protein
MRRLHDAARRRMVVASPPMTPTIVRERTRAGLRMVEASGFPACIVVARDHHGGQVLAVVSDQEPAATLRGLARLVLRDSERQHLSQFLSDRRRRR